MLLLCCDSPIDIQITAEVDVIIFSKKKLDFFSSFYHRNEIAFGTLVPTMSTSVSTQEVAAAFLDEGGAANLDEAILKRLAGFCDSYELR